MYFIKYKCITAAYRRNCAIMSAGKANDGYPQSKNSPKMWPNKNHPIWTSIKIDEIICELVLPTRKSPILAGSNAGYCIFYAVLVR